MRIYLVSISGDPVAEFEIPENIQRPEVIVWQTRGFRWCEPAVRGGEIYEEADTYFMPPQFEVQKSSHAVLDNVKANL